MGKKKKMREEMRRRDFEFLGCCLGGDVIILGLFLSDKNI